MHAIDSEMSHRPAIVPSSRDTGSIFFLLRIALVGLFEYQALNSELNGFCMFGHRFGEKWSSRS